MVQELVAGVDIYERYAFPTPPIMALLLYPFALLPAKAGMAAWLGFKIALTVAALLILLRMVERNEATLPAGVLAIIVVLSARPIVGDLLHGNVNLWILFLLVAAIAAFRAEHDGLAGMALGLAIACKLTPALMLVYFAWKRATTAVIATFVGLAIWWLVVPGAILGTDRNATLLAHWGRQMVRPYVVDGVADAEHINQSLAGLTYRLLTPSIAIHAEDGRPARTISILALDPPAARMALRIVLCIALFALALSCRDPIGERRSPVFLHQIALVCIAMLLLSERSWKHHFVILAPAYVFLVAEAWRQPALRRTIGSLLGFSALAMATTSRDVVPFLGVDGAKLMQAYGAYTWAAIALAIAHGRCLGELRRHGVLVECIDNSRLEKTGSLGAAAA